MKYKYKKQISIITLILVFFVLIFLFKDKIFIKQNTPKIDKYTTNFSPPVDLKQIAFSNEIATKKTTLKIEDYVYEIEINSETTVYEFMKKLKNERKIDFNEVNYIGMGKFIDEINKQKNSADKYWIYYVNNKKANIGISNYKINPGDIVSWKYEANY